MTQLVTTFGSLKEFERGRGLLDGLGLAYEVLLAEPGYRLVAAPALIVDESVRSAIVRTQAREFLCSGWVEFRPPIVQVPKYMPPVCEEGIFGRAAVTVLAPCVADPTRIRIIAQVSGDLGPALPYMNAVMDRASFNPHSEALSFMDGHRLLGVHPHRITVAKADEIVDAWRSLEALRLRIEATWSKRGEIEPSFETRERPPALEIFKRLPRNNCKACGEPSCLAFAVSVWRGDVSVRECSPVYGEGGEKTVLREALDEVCAAIGV